MGKKSDNNADELFNELLDEEKKSQQSSGDKPQKGKKSMSGMTRAGQASTETSTEIKRRKKGAAKSYADLDPSLQAVLSMPDESDEEDLIESDEVTPPPTNLSKRSAQSKNQVKESQKKSQQAQAKSVQKPAPADLQQKKQAKSQETKKASSSQPPAIKKKASAQDASAKSDKTQVTSPPPPSSKVSDDTQKIQMPKVSNEQAEVSKFPNLNLATDTAQTSSLSGMSLEDQLKSANYLELAQNRVLELEKEVQKLRRDNEQLASAGQHFKALTENMKQHLRQAEANYANIKETAEEEKKILTQSLEAKEIKVSALQERLVELEEKINSSFDHVRIRERELENRIEIMKSESDAVTTSKDESILDLKKQVNLVNSDLEKYRIQNQKTVAKLENKEELLRRTVKALRIALTMLEGSSDED